MKTIKILSILFLGSLLYTSCSKDETPTIVNEEEVITTITVTLTPASGGASITLQSQDLDGDGPDAPNVTVSSPLAANTVYNASLKLENETVSPAESINKEIIEEDQAHQFFYSIDNDLVTFNYTDLDGLGNPLGLSFTITTSSTIGDGNLIITLRHEPNKSASGVSDGDITNAGGETELEAVFPIKVQ